jgi:hypothetical protein
MSDVDPGIASSRGQVAIMVTRRCNMTCAHCSVESGPKVSARDPDEATLLRWVRQASDAGIRAIRVTGGEPMLRPTIVRRVLRECRRLGIAGAMTTNGFWGRTAFQARRQLGALKRAGLTSLVVSYDRYHADFQGPGPVRHIALAARRLGIPLSVTMVRSAEDPPDLIGILNRTETETGARVRVYDLQPVGRANDLVESSSAGDVEGFCSACAFPAIAEDGRVMACNGPAYFERTSSPLVVGSLADTTLPELIDRHERDPILETIRTKGPAGLRDELRRIPGFETYPFRSTYRGICDLCHAITRDEKAVAALRDRLARPDLAAARRAAWQVIAGNRQRGAISSSYVNGPAACRIFLRAAWQPDAPFDDDAPRVLGSAHLDWRKLAAYLGGSGLARPLTPVLDHAELRRWAPAFFRDAVRQRSIADGLRELVQRHIIGEIDGILGDLGARGVLLKGGAMLVRTSRGRIPRSTADIDLLVDPAVGPALRNQLIDRGFEEGSGRGHDTYHHLEPISFQGVTVEIHTRLMARFWGLPERELLTDRLPVSEWPSLDTMGAEALAFHAVVHTSSSFYSYGLKAAWDLRVLAEAYPELDWARLARWARTLPAPRAFWVPMGLLARELNVGVPETLLRLAPPDGGGRRLERVAAERLFRATDAFADLDAATKAGMMLLMHHSLKGKAHYVAAKLWWRGSRPATWGDAIRRARRADLVRQAWRNFRRYRRSVVN